MPDTFGAIEVPVQPGTQQPLADPALSSLLSFLHKALCADQAFSLAWTAPGVDPAHPPIVKTFPDNPGEEWLAIRSDCFPALFGWCERGETDWIAEDYEVETVHCKLLWVLPVVEPELQRVRMQLGRAFFKAVYVSLSRGRTPSWVVPGDTDPMAATAGSFLGTTMGWLQVPWVKSWKRTHVEAKSLDGSPAGIYPAFEIDIEWLEKQTLDDTIDTVPTDTLVGADLTIANGATGVVQNEGYLAVTPLPSIGSEPLGEPALWTASTAVAKNTAVVPVESTGFWYVATTGGTTGTTAPDFPTQLGASVTDGQVTWTCWGPAPST